ncbi:MAG: hypothetical protein QXF35_03345 [Candidatus Bilamarchaeaceae archaeon]
MVIKTAERVEEGEGEKGKPIVVVSVPHLTPSKVVPEAKKTAEEIRKNGIKTAEAITNYLSQCGAENILPEGSEIRKLLFA